MNKLLENYKRFFKEDLREAAETNLLQLIQYYVTNVATIDQSGDDAWIRKAEQEQTGIKRKITQLKGKEYFNKVDEIADLILSDAEYSGTNLMPEIEKLANELGFSADQIRDI